MLFQDTDDQLRHLIQTLRPFSAEERRVKLSELRSESKIDSDILDVLRDYFQEEPSVELPLDFKFGKYTITGLLGEGGMGRVYQAWDPLVKRSVALKMIRSDLLGLEGEFHEQGKKSPQELFEEEADALASLQHAGIVSVYDRGFAPDAYGVDVPYCSMELVNGEELNRYCKDRRLGIDRCLETMREVCKAVGSAHSSKVVHRDLKPSNILVDNTGQPRVLDFGLALVMGKSDPLDFLSLGMGTPGYLAPEQLSHEFGQIGYPTDVYALGVILFELLAGHRPYLADPRQESFLSVVTREKPPLLSTLIPDIDKEIEVAIATCLEKNASDRYGNANALQTVLTHCLEKRRFSNMAREIGLLGAKSKQSPPPLPAQPKITRSTARSAPEELSEQTTVFHRPSDTVTVNEPEKVVEQSVHREIPLSNTDIPSAPVSSASPEPETFYPDPSLSASVPEAPATSLPSAIPQTAGNGGAAVWVTVGVVCVLGIVAIVPALFNLGGEGGGKGQIGASGGSTIAEGIMKLNSSRFEDAVSEFDGVLKEDPKNEMALLQRAIAHSQMNEKEKSIADLQTLLELNSRNVLAQQMLAHLKQSDDTTSLPENVSADNIPDPTDKDAVNVENEYQKGLAHLNQGEFQRAVDILGSVTEKSPHYREADINLAMAYFYLSRPADALSKFDDVIQRNPTANNAYNLRAQCHQLLGDDEKAVKDFSELIRLTPGYVEGHNHRGQCYLRLGDYPKAILDFDEVVKLQPGSSLGYEFRGRALIAQEKFKEAIVSLDDAEDRNSQDADIYYHRALAYKGLGDTDKYKKDIDRALRLNPSILLQNR